MGGEEVNAFLTSLALEDHVSAATQNQALCALLFLYREVLREPFPWMDDLVRARRPFRVPVVLTPEEVKHLLDHLTGTTRLIAILLYGSGLRLLECLQLRVKDVNFARHEIFVRDTKGRRDRVTTLPRSAQESLREHLAKARDLHDRDLAAGAGYVMTPTALARKILSAPREWLWQWVFPAKTRFRDAKTGKEYRHHLHAGGHAARDPAAATPPASTSALPVTRSVTPLPPISSSAARTSGRCRSSWAIAT